MVQELIHLAHNRDQYGHLKGWGGGVCDVSSKDLKFIYT
jgi:hypothetical protein